MAEQANPSPVDDSLDLVELVMAIEEALMNPLSGSARRTLKCSVLGEFPQKKKDQSAQAR